MASQKRLRIANYSPRIAFTLIEILISLAIVTILMAVLLPCLSAARARAKQTGCLANLNTLGEAMFMYSDDYDGHLPNGNPPGTVGEPLGTNRVLAELNTKYLNAPAAFRCPSDHDPSPSELVTAEYDVQSSSRLSYDFYSVWWLIQFGPRLNWVAEAPIAWDLKGGRATEHRQQNHGIRGGNIVCGDGHAEWQPQPKWDRENWPNPADHFYQTR